jgi:lysosomal acid phosphatase
VFDSTIALLQGLFPPTPANTIELANETKVTAPLGGYQYVPGECHACEKCQGWLPDFAAAETVEPSNDRSLESWTDCPVITMTLVRYQF